MLQPQPTSRRLTATMTESSSSWAQQYFGHPHSRTGDRQITRATDDADGTGQNQPVQVCSGKLDPTNPASVFVFNVARPTNQSQAMNLSFNPLALGRTYTPEFNTNLVSGAWLPLATYSTLLTNGNQVTMTDTNPIPPPQEFYRIDITYP